MRTFIALEFDINLKNQLGKIQRKLKVHANKGRWTYIDNFHLTMKFLGDTNASQINDIKAQLGNIVKKHHSINLSMDRLGYFPGKDIMRVVWLGVDGDLDKMKELYNTIEWHMRDLGFSKERRKFQPHITLGRDVLFNTKAYHLHDLVKEELDYSFTLNTIALYQSEFSHGKRRYAPIDSFKLRQ